MKFPSIACLTLAMVPVFALPLPSGPLASGGGIEFHPAVAAREPLENDLEALANSPSHPGSEKDPRDFNEGVIGSMMDAELTPLLGNEGSIVDALALGLRDLLPSGSQTGSTSSGGSPLGLNLRNVPRDQSDEEQTELLVEGNGRALLGVD